uniref:Uncharacterized protein n=1 Tax=Anguilla anguilla TaxID=7936 RepID=A0A0E9SQC4_ANGAN
MKKKEIMYIVHSSQSTTPAATHSLAEPIRDSPRLESDLL